MMYFIIALIALGIDQLTKILLYGEQMSLIGDFLWLKKVGLNYGAGWGMFAGARWIFVCLSIIVAGIIIYLLIQKRFFNSKFFKTALSFLLGGLLGNLYDRIALGGVRDFLAFNFFDFPVFNVADIAITISAIMLVIYIVFFDNDKSKKESKTTKDTENGKKNNS